MSEHAVLDISREPIERMPAPQSETAAIFQVIERAAMSPNVDIDKMERLLQMQERVMARNARSAYMAGLAVMQNDLPVIRERGAIKAGNEVRSTYARWEDINEAIKPIMKQHGFAISFRTDRQDDKIIVTGVLSHRDGHTEQTTMHLPIDASGSKNAVQAIGSSTSYGKRYTAMALLNLTSAHSEDDDGAATGAPVTISAEQVETLQKRIVAVGINIERFFKVLKIEKLEQLTTTQFDEAMQILAAKEAKNNKPTLRDQLQASVDAAGGSR